MQVRRRLVCARSSIKLWTHSVRILAARCRSVYSESALFAGLGGNSHFVSCCTEVGLDFGSRVDDESPASEPLTIDMKLIETPSLLSYCNLQ